MKAAWQTLSKPLHPNSALPAVKSFPADLVPMCPTRHTTSVLVPPSAALFASAKTPARTSLVSRIVGLTDIRLRDLRHTFATWLRQNGTELDVIASQLAHRDLRMTMRSTRIASAQVRQAVNGLDSMLGDDMSKMPDTKAKIVVEAKPLLNSAVSDRGVGWVVGLVHSSKRHARKEEPFMHSGSQG